MACNCKNKVDSPHIIKPNEPCATCAEKHFSTAYALTRECGYEGVNRQHIIGEIVLAQWHIYQKDYHLAELLRAVRHKIQNREEKRITNQSWAEIANRFDAILSGDNKND